MVKRPFPSTFLLALLAWIGVVGLGFGLSQRYEKGAAPGPRTEACWPGDLPVALDPSRQNLILVAHPRCPCTGATLDELVSILTRCREQLRVTVLFTVPAGAEAGSGWRDSDLERAARRIPGVAVVDDPDGKAAALLGARASGEAFLFDGAGRLLFSGGITGARGHVGGNAGEDAVIALARAGSADRSVVLRHTPVFGCALVGAADGGKMEAGL